MSVLWDIVKYLVAAQPGETVQHYAYRLFITAVTTGTAFALGIHLVWASTNFTQQSDFNELKRLQLDEKILNMRERQCRAIATATPENNQNQSVKRFAVEKLNEYTRQYSLVAGERYRIPDCEELS